MSRTKPAQLVLCCVCPVQEAELPGCAAAQARAGAAAAEAGRAHSSRQPAGAAESDGRHSTSLHKQRWEEHRYRAVGLGWSGGEGGMKGPARHHLPSHSMHSCVLRLLAFQNACITCLNQPSPACSQGLFQLGCCVLLPPAIAAVQLTKQPTNNGAWLPLPLQTSSEAAVLPKRSIGSSASWRWGSSSSGSNQAACNGSV